MVRVIMSLVKNAKNLTTRVFTFSFVSFRCVRCCIVTYYNNLNITKMIYNVRCSVICIKQFFSTITEYVRRNSWCVPASYRVRRLGYRAAGKLHERPITIIADIYSLCIYISLRLSGCISNEINISSIWVYVVSDNIVVTAASIAYKTFPLMLENLRET